MISLDLETDSIVQKQGELPTGWKWQVIGSLVKQTERINPSSRFANDYFEYVDISSVDNQLGVITVTKKILGTKAPSRAKKIIKPNDIIIATTRPYLKNIALVPPSLEEAVCSTGFCVMRVNPDLALPKYLYYACRSDIVINQLIPKQRGANYPAVTDSDVFDSLIPVPCPDNSKISLDIQHGIVSRIESLLGELKGDHKLVKKMRRDTDMFLNTSLNEVFKNLEPLTKIVPLREVATSFNGRASGQGNSNVRVFKTRHVYPHSLRLDNPSYMKEEQAQKLPPDRYLKPGDVLMANIAEGTLGRVTYVHECEDDWTVDTQIMILRSKDKDILHGKWLYYYLWSERGQHEILSRRSGIAFAEKRGQTHIYPKDVLGIPVPKPPIDQQRQAIVHLDSILSHVESMQEIFKEDINLLDRLEQSILEKAFQGQL